MHGRWWAAVGLEQMDRGLDDAGAEGWARERSERNGVRFDAAGTHLP